MKRLKAFALCAAAILVTQSCSKSGDDDNSGGSRNPDGFVNRSSEADFFTKGDALRDMLSGGNRLNLTGPTSTRRSLLQGSVFSVLESFASNGKKTGSLNESDCDAFDGGMTGALPTNSAPESNSAPMAIYEDQSCVLHLEVSKLLTARF